MPFTPTVLSPAVGSLPDTPAVTGHGVLAAAREHAAKPPLVGHGPHPLPAGQPHVRLGHPVPFIRVPTLPDDVRRQLASGGALESRWVWIGLATAAVLCAVGLVWWGRARPWVGQRAVGRRVGGAVLVTVLTVAAVGAGVNSYVGYFPTVHSFLAYVEGSGPVVQPDPALANTDGSSRVVPVILGSERYGVRPARMYVYLPPRYADPGERGRRYPVVYLLPGFPGRSADWFAGGDARATMDLLVRRRIVPPMILVGLDEAAGRGLYDSECLNAVAGPQEESFLTGTVVSYVDSHYRTERDRRARAIGGMSSGGFCALNLGLRHTGEYSVVGVLEGFGDPGRTGYAHLDWRRSLMTANTPSTYIPTMRFGSRMALLLDAPQSDRSGVIATRALAIMLARRGQQVGLRVEAGQSHTWREARAALPYLLAFAAARFAASARPPGAHAWEPRTRHHLPRRHLPRRTSPVSNQPRTRHSHPARPT